LRTDDLGHFLDEAELCQGSDAVVETDFLDDFAILELQHGRSRKLHLAAGVGRQASDQEIIESGTGMRTASLPTTDDIVAFRDQLGCAPEVEIRERLPKVGNEDLDVIATSAGSCSEYCNSMSGAASSSTIFRLQVAPQKSVNQRPTIALLSSSFDMF
jgi:hypothetical protein